MRFRVSQPRVCQEPTSQAGLAYCHQGTAGVPVRQEHATDGDVLFPRLVVPVSQVGKARGIVQERQLELADWAIALFGDDDFGFVFKDTATMHIYPLTLHDALPTSARP